MKKALIVLAVLLAVLAAGAAAFIATFDLNRFRPMILREIKNATGKEARIGRLGLAWKGGLAARAEGLALFDKGDEEPDAALDYALVRVQIAPLLRKQVRVTGVWIVGPRLVIEKFPDGSLSVAGIRPPSGAAFATERGGPVQQARSVDGSAALVGGFLVDSVQIQDGKFRYIDRTSPEALDVTISDFDADVKNVSLKGPVSFAARASVFGSKQNLAIGGRVTPPDGNEAAVVDHFTLQADLGAIDLRQFSDSVPSVRAAGLRSLDGMLKASVDRLALDPAGMAGAQAAVTLKDGAVSLASVPLPVESIQLEASLQNGAAEVKNLSARFAEGTLQFSGTVNDLPRRAVSTFRASARELSIGKLARAANPRVPRLEGHVSLDFEGRAQGLNGPAVTHSLWGQGRLAMKDGVLVNSNLLRTVVDKLAQIPGVGKAAISRIPPQYLRKLDEPNTVLRPFETPFAVREGRLFFDRLQIPTDLFVLAGAGSVGFDRSIAMQAAIFFDPGLSKALAAAAPPTQYFANAQTGQLEIQLSIQGVPPNVQVIPNLDAALQRVGQQVVGDLLSKKDPKDILSGLLNGGVTPQQQAQQQAAAPVQGGGIPIEPEPSQQPQQQSQSTEDALLGLLTNALNKDKQQ